jgi:hypothetical protein
MFTITRRHIAALTAVVAMAAGASAVKAPTADAAPRCAQWRLPASFSVYQSNGWKVTPYTYSGWTRKVFAGAPNTTAQLGTMTFSRFDVSGINPQVRFTVVLDNGTAGVYSGTIDEDGFLSGQTWNRFAPWYTARFYVLGTMECA